MGCLEVGQWAFLYFTSCNDLSSVNAAWSWRAGQGDVIEQHTRGVTERKLLVLTVRRRIYYGASIGLK